MTVNFFESRKMASVPSEKFLEIMKMFDKEGQHAKKICRYGYKLRNICHLSPLQFFRLLTFAWLSINLQVMDT